jgi:hypothetical protein
MTHLRKLMTLTVNLSSTVYGRAQGVVDADGTSSPKETVVSSALVRLVAVPSAREDAHQVYDQPLMATGMDLLGQPRRFPAHQTPGHSSMVAY